MTHFFLWLLYFALHSALASSAAKTAVQRISPVAGRWYRIGYNLIAAGGLAFLLWLLIRQPAVYWFTPQRWSRFLGAGLAAAGAGMTWLAFRPYNIREFIGLEQPGGAPAAPPALHTGGWNAWVRHPLYLGALVLLAGGWLCFPTTAATGLVAAVLTYLPFGIYFEEQKLLRQFGPAYRAYQERVRYRLLPFLW